MKKVNLSGPEYLIVFRCIIRDRDNQILLLKRDRKRQYNAGKWELVGGKLVRNEDINASSESIIEREVGLIVKPTTRRYYFHSRVVSEKGKYQGFTYIEVTGEAEFVAGEISIDGDHESYAWVNFSNVFKYDLSIESKKALTQYAQDLSKDLAVNEPGRIPVVISAKTLVKNNEDKFLLLKRSSKESFPKKWDLPGGKLTSFENLNELLRREVFEETGLVIQVTEPNAYINSQVINDGKYRGFTFVNIISFAEVTAGEINLSREHSGYKWVSKDYLFSQDLADYVKLPLSEIFLKKSESEKSHHNKSAQRKISIPRKHKRLRK